MPAEGVGAVLCCVRRSMPHEDAASRAKCCDLRNLATPLANGCLRQNKRHTVAPEGLMPDHIRKRLEEEIKALERELTQELPAEIKKAVAMGDLSENAEYHMAKQRQAFVNARLGQLKKRMGELAMVKMANIPNDKVGFGATVVVFDSSKNEEITYKLVTSEESDE